MARRLRPALVAFLGLTLATGALYPALVFALARLVWPRAADGSLVRQDGRVVGSRWIAQAFTDPGHFWGRPSATVDARGLPSPWNAARSGGSNLAPGSPALARLVAERAAALRAADPDPADPVPADLVLASGSGLDPHIRPAAALWQVPRVARRRGLDEAQLRRLVAAHTEAPQLGFLGEPRVNVLELNLALDALAGHGRR
jgi:K+-transporting ATPase ATPase C chain